MPEALRTRLRHVLESRYAHLRHNLERIVGSRDGAHDALQETWVRLENIGDATTVRNPAAYLLRMAVNVAAHQHRRDDDPVAPEDIDALFHAPDASANPERTASARSDIAAVDLALASLTPRCLAIFVAAKRDGQSNREIAQAMGISARLVEKELHRALQACQQAVGQPAYTRQRGARGI
ncbi:ECF family sigma factor [Bordetella ansorpii]|uniref:ECF family sigma factor n=1 Tax=Bordetella ansorpii TaxID=288768 RepID=A0A157RCW0_9BORD|nr:sigma-70 family RNA polymerase sigma factor [Bordetella ansorpii]SAI55179.1 ECF family sigma factor [Bordetella ansorpii]